MVVAIEQRRPGPLDRADFATGAGTLVLIHGNRDVQARHRDVVLDAAGVIVDLPDGNAQWRAGVVHALDRGRQRGNPAVHQEPDDQHIDGQEIDSISPHARIHLGDGPENVVECRHRFLR